MRLSRLKLAGFKTFVDPTTVLTSANLVGVVGPNGCGKSNIIDAVRWVLGEMRASALRGDSMQDVIFNGSTTRKAVSRASVELVFDNREGRAAGHWSRYAEISVKRVLDRSGDSSYHINNTQVRRKDVIDLFLGTGLGPKAYAIIEQGMISRIIEARPEDIRGFLEEAAGVTKYRERRRETEGRLRDARDNLARLDDIRGELGERIEHLETQAKVAARYRELLANQERNQHLLWLLKHDEASQRAEAVAAELAETSRRLETDTARLQALEHAVEAARGGHEAAAERTQQLQGELYTASAEVSRLESEQKHVAEAREKSLQRLAALADEHTHWTERRQTLETDRERWTALDEQAALRLERAEARHEGLATELPDYEGARSDAAAAVSLARQELALAEQQLRVAETDRAHAARALEQLGQRRARIEAACAAIVRPDALAVERLAERLQHAETTLAEAEAELAREQQALPQAEHALREAAASEREQQRALTALRAQHTALVELQGRSGRQGELGKWLRTQGFDEAPALWQALQVDAGWERAVECVLRERLAARISSDAADLQRVLDTPPPESFALLRATREEGSSIPLPAGPVPGATPLANHVACDDATLRPVLDEWLSRAFAVESLDAHLAAQAALPAGVTLVDREGRMLDRHGLVHHVPDSGTQGVLERQREIDTLATRIEEMQARAELAAGTLETAEQQVAMHRERLAGLRSDTRELQQSVHREQLVHLELRRDAQRADEQAQSLAHEQAELADSERAERERSLEAEFARDAAEERISVLRERLAVAQQALDEHEARLREARAQESAARHDVQEARFSARECAGKLEDIARNLTLAGEQFARIEHEQATLRDGLEAQPLDRYAAALDEALSLRSECERALARQRDEQEQAAAHLRECEGQRLQTEHALSPLRERVGELRLESQAAALAAGQFAERLDEARAEREALRPLLAQPGNNEAALQGELTRVTRALQGLGAVNLAALDELRTASERKQYLDAQNDDLVEAITTLEDAIRRIDRETREQLQQTYDTVNAQFATLFPQLFGGGRATLEMTGEEILDAGIQIVAQPPGKKNSSIHLLSGGEKALTAIALVFSMFQLNPAPFCMLDEVDAPLDDANTERYCRMVERMSGDTQFIFISHNKLTMEIAQQLVGVTMQEQGVSRIVEVDIEKALEMAEAAPA